MKKKLGLEDWKKIYYPIEAEAAAKGSMLDAVNHSFKKWSGLTPRILEKYNLVTTAGFIGVESKPYDFWIDDNSCALCQKYINAECKKCPLYIVRGDVRCDNHRSTEDMTPYQEFSANGNPKPMLKWLRKAQKYAESKKRKK